MNITQINKLSVEELQDLSTEELMQAKEVLAKSKAKKSRLRLDVINVQLKKRQKEGENVEQASMDLETDETTEEITDSSKSTETEAEEEEAETEEAPEKEQKPKKPTPKKRTRKEKLSEIEEMKKKLEELQAQVQEQGEIFPPKLELNSEAIIHRLPKLSIETIQRYLVERPYRLMLVVDEKVDGELTIFRILYLNNRAFVLLDMTRDLDSTINASPADLLGKVLSLDGKKCPYSFYIEEQYILEEKEEGK
mgnify:CR=1 FL=1